MGDREEYIFPKVESEPTPQGSVALPRYRKLKRLSIIITSLVALVPLMIMTLINYYQDQDAYHAETQPAIFFLAELKHTFPLAHEGIQAANYTAHHRDCTI